MPYGAFVLLIVLFLIPLLASPTATLAQELPHRHEQDRSIDFPNVPGYLTLKVDLHMHTVFSDGSVWPNIRVEEAIRDGLDAIAMTEHLEYQPHSEDIPHPDRNRAFELATGAAANSDLLILPGSEITRDMPPGHANAVFIEDANRLLVPDSVGVFVEAAKQSAFVFWNHPNWTAQRKDGVATLTPTHRYLLENNLLHGIEVVNELTYSDEALQIALDAELAIIGASDIHGLVDWRFNVNHGGHRPITLVFARERSVEGIKEALFAGRTAAYFDNTIVGRSEQLVPLVESSLSVTSAKYQGDSSVMTVELENSSDVTFILDNRTEFTFHNAADVILVAANATSTLEVKVPDRLAAVSLSFEVANAVIAPGTHPTIVLEAVADESVDQ
ncbi:MAG: PHP domain-containing protein [Rhodothermales bacterium]|nr:PHP domain-containing protein [Rhodothermales bacterium]